MATSPILWGGLACGGFYGLIHAGVLDGQFVRQYFASHPVEYAATAMFFIGLAALVIKLLSISIQHQRLDEPLLEPIPSGGQPVADCLSLAARLGCLPAARQNDYLVRRLDDALEHVRRSGSAEGLEEELRYLADMDAGRVHASYGLVRVIIWAIPVLGFLGTVIGITLAIGKLAPESLETSLPEVMTSLSVAFYTTTQALGLSIVLMFAQFISDRKENTLLDKVDQRVEAEMVGRFERVSDGADDQLGAIRRMAEAVIASSDQLVRRQTELWRLTMEAAEQRWATTANAAADQLQTALAGALDESLKAHARELTANEQRFADKNRENWERIQQTLVQNTEIVASLHEDVLKEAELLGRAVEATGQVASLEETLNHNLRALAGSSNFEQTVMSLAAAIHLLNSRLSQMPADMPVVQLEPDRKTDQAA